MFSIAIGQRTSTNNIMKIRIILQKIIFWLNLNNRGDSSGRLSLT